MNVEIKKIELDEDIFLLENILSPEECEVLIAASEEVGYEEATVFDGRQHRMIKGVRNNLRLIADDEEFAEELWGKVAYFFTEIIQGFKSYGLKTLYNFS